MDSQPNETSRKRTRSPSPVVNRDWESSDGAAAHPGELISSRYTTSDRDEDAHQSIEPQAAATPGIQRLDDAEDGEGGRERSLVDTAPVADSDIAPPPKRRKVGANSGSEVDDAQDLSGISTLKVQPNFDGGLAFPGGAHDSDLAVHPFTEESPLRVDEGRNRFGSARAESEFDEAREPLATFGPHFSATVGVQPNFEEGLPSPGGACGSDPSVRAQSREWNFTGRVEDVLDVGMCGDGGPEHHPSEEGSPSRMDDEWGSDSDTSVPKSPPKTKKKVPFFNFLSAPRSGFFTPPATPTPPSSLFHHFNARRPNPPTPPSSQPTPPPHPKLTIKIRPLPYTPPRERSIRILAKRLKDSTGLGPGPGPAKGEGKRASTSKSRLPKPNPPPNPPPRARRRRPAWSARIIEQHQRAAARNAEVGALESELPRARRPAWSTRIIEQHQRAAARNAEAEALDSGTRDLDGRRASGSPNARASLTQQPTPPSTPPTAQPLFTCRLALSPPPSPYESGQGNEFESEQGNESDLPWPEVTDFATFMEAAGRTQDLIEGYLRVVEAEAARASFWTDA